MPDRVLLVDDDVELCELVSEYLAAEGFAVDVMHGGGKGVERALSGEHDIVILDVMLPILNGFEALRRIRAESTIPVLMLTARGDDVDRIVGLEMGADDYLAKPFNPRELVARLRAILRRTSAADPSSPPDHPISVGDVTLDPGARLVRRKGEVVDLTAVEFDVLAILLRAAGRVVTREALVRAALDRELLPYDRSIDMHVSNVRRKLGADGAERIKTIRSVGYLYTLPPAGAG